MALCRKIAGALLLAGMLIAAPMQALAATQTENESTGYEAQIVDDADLLTDEEESQLLEDMYGCTDYGNAVFVTTDYNIYSTSSYYAKSYYHNNYGTANGTLFLIDMDNRNIYIFSDGANYDIITNAKAETITDNVYRYASQEDYYSCASNAFAQVETLLAGGSVAQPMKHASNVLLALMIALLVNFLIVNRASSLKRASTNVLIDAAKTSVQFTAPVARMTHESKKYSPVEHSSGGGGGGGSFSGGGGSSGGGGGHSF